MSINGSTPTPAGSHQPNINPAFRYLGIPSSWLDSSSRRTKFRLPSKNTTTFLITTTSLISLYLYDRRQCHNLKQAYIKKVQHLSESLLQPDHQITVHQNNSNHLDWMPRKVNVYGARIPEDVQVDRAAQWFKKYVKPILVAAAIDYTIHNGTSPGALGRKISEEIRDRRIIEAAREKDGIQPSILKPGMPGYREWYAEREKLNGGTLILGRTTLKEYLWGLEDGYKRPIPIDELDDDERFAKQLEEQGIFDLPESSESIHSDPDDRRTPPGLRSIQQESQDHPDHLDPTFPTTTALTGDERSKKSSSFLNIFSSPLHSSLASTSHTTYPTGPSDRATGKTLAPVAIPSQPPILLVPFDHPIGIRWWPLKIYRFFNRRHQVRMGAEAAMSLIESQTRPIEGPIDLNGINELSRGLNDQDYQTEPELEIRLTGSKDLDFLAPQADRHLRRSYQKVAKNVLEERRLYRDRLKERLSRARSIEDQPSSFDPPSSPSDDDRLNESQLRQEAFQKEKRWQDLLHAWSIVRRGSGVCWDPEMSQALKIFDHNDSTTGSLEHTIGDRSES